MPVRPLLAGIGSTAIVVAWHVPAPSTPRLRHPMLHQAEHASFLVAGLLLWAPVLSPATRAAEALAFLFVTRNVQAVLGNVLLWAPHPLYRDSGSLHDQRLAGAIMLGEGLWQGSSPQAGSSDGCCARSGRVRTRPQGRTPRIGTRGVRSR